MKYRTVLAFIAAATLAACDSNASETSIDGDWYSPGLDEYAFISGLDYSYFVDVGSCWRIYEGQLRQVQVNLPGEASSSEAFLLEDDNFFYKSGGDLYLGEQYSQDRPRFNNLPFGTTSESASDLLATKPECGS